MIARKYQLFRWGFKQHLSADQVEKTSGNAKRGTSLFLKQLNNLFGALRSKEETAETLRTGQLRNFT